METSKIITAIIVAYLVVMTLCSITYMIINPELTRAQILLDIWWVYIPLIPSYMYINKIDKNN